MLSFALRELSRLNCEQCQDFHSKYEGSVKTCITNFILESVRTYITDFTAGSVRTYITDFTAGSQDLHH